MLFMPIPEVGKLFSCKLKKFTNKKFTELKTKIKKTKKSLRLPIYSLGTDSLHLTTISETNLISFHLKQYSKN